MSGVELLYEELKSNPGSFYAEDKFVAVLLPSDTIVIFKGEFAGLDEAQMNDKLVELLTNF